MFTCVTFTDGMKMRGVKGAANGNAKSRNSVVSCSGVKDQCVSILHCLALILSSVFSV